MYLSRAMESAVLNATESFPCVVVYGPRQVGKSTMLRHLYPSMPYVTLDDSAQKQLAQDNPRLFLQAHPWPVVIDEVQKAPGLLSEIKIAIDEQRMKWLEQDEQRQVMYLLTGSSQFELREAVSESLAGRAGMLELGPFSRPEVSKVSSHPFDLSLDSLQQAIKRCTTAPLSRPEIFEEIFRGGMPDVVTKVANRDTYYPSYVSTYIERDVRSLIAASSEASFLRFMSYVAMRTAQQVNYDDISSAVGIDGKTCRRWLSILESSGIIFFLQPYFPNASTRIIKSPKLYFTDTGLCAHLCGWPNAEMLERGAMAGAFYETYVVGEAFRSLRNAGRDPKHELFYYRDKDNKEIDLLLIHDGTIYPAEVKKGINPIKPDKNFKVLAKYGLPIAPGVVLDSTDQLMPINENAWVFPASLIGF